MGSLTGKDLRNCWIANAARLDRKRHFANYSSEQREEVMRKGFLGRYPPDQAIRAPRKHAERGRGYRKEKFNDEMREYFGPLATRSARNCSKFSMNSRLSAMSHHTNSMNRRAARSFFDQESLGESYFSNSRSAVPPENHRFSFGPAIPPCTESREKTYEVF